MNKLNQNVTKGKTSAEVFQSPGWIQDFATLNKRKASIRLGVLILITLFFCIQIPKLDFDYNFNSFFPEGDEDLAYYEMLNDEFGEFNNFLFVVSQHESPRSQASLSQLNSTIERLKTWNEIEGIRSPFSSAKIQITPFGINQIELVSPDKGFSDAELARSKLLGKFFGRDDESIMFVIRHQAFQKKKEADQFFSKLNTYLKSMFQEDYLISGKIQMQHDFTLKLENELSKMLTLASVFVIIVLLLLFRSFKGIVIPIITLLATLIWTMGLISITGKSIDIMVVIIPSILLIVALSDVIHFVHKYDDFKNSGFGKIDSLKSTILFIGKATCLTSITTCVGFLSLYVIPIKPIRDFGLFTAFGVAFAFLITFLLIPSLLFFFSKPIERTGVVQSSWRTSLGIAFLRLVRNRRKVTWIITSLSLLLISGLTFLRLNTSIIVGFQKGEPELDQVTFFDQNFDGYKPFEIGITINPNYQLIDSGVLTEIEKIEEYIQDNYGVAQIESPLNLVRSINAGIYGASQKYFKLPKAKDINRIKRVYYSPKLHETRSLFQNEERNVIRMVGRSLDIGSSQARMLNKDLKAFLKRGVNESIISAQLTGTSYLIDKTDDYIVQALLKGLGLAVISVSLLLFLFFKDWKMVIFSLIPNLTPILILFGLMGLFHIDLNISTAVIFTVAFGIAVDDSIHLIARYYLEKRSFKSPLWALKKSFCGTGKSIIVTSLVILAGFSLFMTSGLSSPYYLGLFIVLTAIIALILDLTILPLLILKSARKN